MPDEINIETQLEAFIASLSDKTDIITVCENESSMPNALSMLKELDVGTYYGLYSAKISSDDITTPVVIKVARDAGAKFVVIIGGLVTQYIDSSNYKFVDFIYKGSGNPVLIAGTNASSIATEISDEYFSNVTIKIFLEEE